MTRGATFWAGVRRCLPIAASAVPFGMAVGLTSVDNGMSVWGALSMSVIMFAGASQLAAVQLTADQAPTALVIAIAVLINLRFVMYSAALAPHLRGPGRLARVGLAYLLTDQAFAVSVARFRDPDRRAHAAAFYVGAGVSLWVAWQIGTVLGASLGTLPLSTDIAPGLVFMALAIAAVRERTDLWVAMSASTTYLALCWLPFGTGLLPAAGVGLMVGYLVDRRVR